MATVTFQSGTRRLDVAPIVFEPIEEGSSSDPFTVRRLIEKIAHESIRDFRLRESDRAFQLLTKEKIDAGIVTGKIGSPREERQEVDEDLAIGQALQAFEDGLYLLFVDGHEKRQLDELVALKPETEVTVIRLVALAGR